MNNKRLLWLLHLAAWTTTSLAFQSIAPQKWMAASCQKSRFHRSKQNQNPSTLQPLCRTRSHDIISLNYFYSYSSEEDEELQQEVLAISGMLSELEDMLTQPANVTAAVPTAASHTTTKAQTISSTTARNGMAAQTDTTRQDTLDAYHRAKSSVSRLDSLRRELAALEHELDEMEQLKKREGDRKRKRREDVKIRQEQEEQPQKRHPEKKFFFFWDKQPKEAQGPVLETSSVSPTTISVEQQIMAELENPQSLPLSFRSQPYYNATRHTNLIQTTDYLESSPLGPPPPRQTLVRGGKDVLGGEDADLIRSTDYLKSNPLGLAPPRWAVLASGVDGRSDPANSGHTPVLICATDYLKSNPLGRAPPRCVVSSPSKAKERGGNGDCVQSRQQDPILATDYLKSNPLGPPVPRRILVWGDDGYDPVRSSAMHKGPPLIRATDYLKSNPLDRADALDDDCGMCGTETGDEAENETDMNACMRPNPINETEHRLIVAENRMRVITIVGVNDTAVDDESSSEPEEQGNELQDAQGEVADSSHATESGLPRADTLQLLEEEIRAAVFKEEVSQGMPDSPHGSVEQDEDAPLEPVEQEANPTDLNQNGFELRTAIEHEALFLGIAEQDARPALFHKNGHVSSHAAKQAQDAKNGQISSHAAKQVEDAARPKNKPNPQKTGSPENVEGRMRPKNGQTAPASQRKQFPSFEIKFGIKNGHDLNSGDVVAPLRTWRGSDSGKSRTPVDAPSGSAAADDAASDWMFDETEDDAVDWMFEEGDSCSASLDDQTTQPFQQDSSSTRNNNPPTSKFYQSQQQQQRPSTVSFPTVGFYNPLLYQSRSKKVATAADVKRSRWGPSENGKVQKITEALTASGSLEHAQPHHNKTTAQDLLSRQQVQRSRSIADMAKEWAARSSRPVDKPRIGMSEPSQNKVHTHTPAAHQDTKSHLNTKRGVASHSASLQQLAKEWAVRNRDSDEATGTTGRAAETSPATTPNVKTTASSTGGLMEQLSREWTAMNKDTRESADSQSSRPKNKDTNSVPHARQQAVPAMPEQRVARPKEAGTTATPGAAAAAAQAPPQVLPESYELVVAWAQNEMVPPTMNKIIYMLRNCRVSSLASAKLSRWGEAETRRADDYTAAMREASHWDDRTTTLPDTNAADQVPSPATSSQSMDQLAAEGQQQLPQHPVQVANGIASEASLSNDLPSMEQLAREWASLNRLDQASP